MFIIVVCFYSVFHIYAKTAWCYADHHVLCVILGRLFSEKDVSFLQKKDAYNQIVKEARARVRTSFNIVQAEQYLREVAREEFYACAEYQKGWCNNFERLLRWADNLFPCMSLEEKSFARIEVYMMLGRGNLYHESDKRDFFLKPRSSKLYVLLVNHVKECGHYGARYRFLIKDNGLLLFSFIECLEAIAQGKCLLVLTKDMSRSGCISIHGRCDVSLSDQLNHDRSHCAVMCKDMLVFNACEGGLYQRFVKEILKVIRKYWAVKGLEYLVAAFSLLHEKKIYNMTCSKSYTWFESLWYYLEHNPTIADPDFYTIVESLLPKECTKGLCEEEKKSKIRRILCKWEKDLLSKVFWAMGQRCMLNKKDIVA